MLVDVLPAKTALFAEKSVSNCWGHSLNQLEAICSVPRSFQLPTLGNQHILCRKQEDIKNIRVNCTSCSKMAERPAGVPTWDPKLFEMIQLSKPLWYN